ncbi:MAG: tRNA (adenosine(37)-N6)-threonylcarbamoyltransferase complex dimerization subunit type 1 TsaB, partial [Woeseiaceae bacterium]|nr:tRNA (adenosine(37)-N6)-threonylcarbamoyltransferase complex dimerization subunit type 1 TsaB [Woeseiaceae bacterium]
PGLADRNKERLSTINGVLYPSANALLDLGIAAVRDGRMLAPEQINPAYLRQKVAEKPRSQEA